MEQLKGKLQPSTRHSFHPCGAGQVGEKITWRQRGVVELQSVKKCPLLFQISFQAGIRQLGTWGRCASSGLPTLLASPYFTFYQWIHPDPIPSNLTMSIGTSVFEGLAKPGKHPLANQVQLLDQPIVSHSCVHGAETICQAGGDQVSGRFLFLPSNWASADRRQKY